MSEVGPEASSLVLIACPAVVGEMADDAMEGLDCRRIDPKLHLRPKLLKEALAAAVDAADGPGVTIVLGYGLCSNAVLGLKTRHATLVVPRVDDCIAMFLGSNEAFADQADRAPGTYYVSKAYLEECDTIFSDHEALIEKRGVERADEMMRLLLQSYTRILIIDMDRDDLSVHEARVADFARRFGLVIERVRGDERIVNALASGVWGEDFVVAAPGHELTLYDFRPELRPDCSGP